MCVLKGNKRSPGSLVRHLIGCVVRHLIGYLNADASFGGVKKLSSVPNLPSAALTLSFPTWYVTTPVNFYSFVVYLLLLIVPGQNLFIKHNNSSSNPANCATAYFTVHTPPPPPPPPQVTGSGPELARSPRPVVLPLRAGRRAAGRVGSGEGRGRTVRPRPGLWDATRGCVAPALSGAHRWLQCW